MLCVGGEKCQWNIIYYQQNELGLICIKMHVIITSTVPSQLSIKTYHIPCSMQLYSGSHCKNKKQTVFFTEFFLQMTVDASHVIREGVYVEPTFRKCNVVSDLFEVLDGEGLPLRSVVFSFEGSYRFAHLGLIF